MNGSTTQCEKIIGTISTIPGELNGSVCTYSEGIQANIDRVQLTEADKLKEKRMIALTGEAAGQAEFDGSQDIEIYTAIAVLTNEEIEQMLT